jgi:hypothetical protein
MDQIRLGKNDILVSSDVVSLYMFSMAGEILWTKKRRSNGKSIVACYG